MSNILTSYRNYFSLDHCEGTAIIFGLYCTGHTPACSLDDSYTHNEVLPKVVTLLEQFAELRSLYWEFLDHPGRCGVLSHKRAKCYARIVNFWLLFLEAPPDPEEIYWFARNAANLCCLTGAGSRPSVYQATRTWYVDFAILPSIRLVSKMWNV